MSQGEMPEFLPLQIKALEALRALNAVYCMARDQGSPVLSAAAESAGRQIDSFITYAEFEGERGQREGEPLPWLLPPH